MKKSSAVIHTWIGTTLIESNPDTLFVKIITDSYYRLKDNFEGLVRNKTSIHLKSYRLTNVRDLCNIFITDLNQIFSGPNWIQGTSETEYFRLWSYWIKNATAGLTIPTESSVLFALTNMEEWNLPMKHWDTIYTSPLLTFVIALDRKTQTFVWLKWVCVNCDYNQYKFLAESPFDLDTTTKFVEFFGHNNPSYLNIKLIIASGTTVQQYKFTCQDQTTKVSIIKRLKPSTNPGCQLATIFIMEEMADHHNYTVIHGNYHQRKKTELPHKFIANIKLGQANSRLFSFEKEIIRASMTESVMEDTVGVLPYYCDKVDQFKMEKSLKLMGKPFRANVWILVGVSSLALFMFSLIKSKVKTSESTENIEIHNQLFDIFSMLLQQGTNKENYPINILFVTISFVLAFYYEFDVTCKLIVPPKPFVFGTLSEILNEGYLINIMTSSQIFNSTKSRSRLINYWKGFVDKDLQQEGFAGNLSTTKFWKIVARGSNTDFSLEEGEFIGMGAAYSMNRKDMELLNPNLLFKSKCHIIKKRYGNVMTYLLVYSIRARQFRNTMARLFYESGIRVLYNELYNAGRMRMVKRHRNVEKDLAMKLDLRMFALMTVSGVVFGTAVICFLFELMLKCKRKKIDDENGFYENERVKRPSTISLISIADWILRR